MVSGACKWRRQRRRRFPRLGVEVSCPLGLMISFLLCLLLLFFFKMCIHRRLQEALICTVCDLGKIAWQVPGRSPGSGPWRVGGCAEGAAAAWHQAPPGPDSLFLIFLFYFFFWKCLTTFLAFRVCVDSVGSYTKKQPTVYTSVCTQLVKAGLPDLNMSVFFKKSIFFSSFFFSINFTVI